MSAFLMLFSEYRDALAEIALLKAENARLIGEASAANARAEESDRRVEDIKRMADFCSYQIARRNVFARAEAPVAPAVVEPMPVPRRMMARDVAAQRTREAFAKQQQNVMAGLRAEANIDDEAKTA